MSQIRYTTYMTDEIGPLPYCPGCGHQPLVEALASQAAVALDNQQLSFAQRELKRLEKAAIAPEKTERFGLQ